MDLNSVWFIRELCKDFFNLDFLQDNLEVVKAENGILRKQLESKTEGLLILSKEVVKLKHEINQLRATDCRQMEVGMKNKILILLFYFS